MILSAFLLIAAVVVLARLVFGLAVYTLPAAAGSTAAFAAHAAGAGWLAVAVTGVLAAITTLGLGQTLFALARSPLARVAVGLVYGVPAAAVAFGVAYGIVAPATSSSALRVVFSLAAAAVVGGVAYARISALAPPIGGPERGDFRIVSS